MLEPSLGRPEAGLHSLDLAARLLNLLLRGLDSSPLGDGDVGSLEGMADACPLRDTH